MSKGREPEDADDSDDGDDGDESESRTLFLIGDVEEKTVKSVITGLFRLAEVDLLKPIYLVVNTYGGEVDEAFALYDAMQFCPAPVRTIGLGKVMSAGCLILAAGQKGHRMLGEYSRLMYHAGWDNVGGDIVQQETKLHEFKRTERLYDSLLATETGHTLEEVEALYKPHRLDRYMDASEALAFGFVDKLIRRKGSA